MTTGDFDRQTTADALNEGVWTATLGGELSGFGGIHGGYVMALALRTMSILVEDSDRSPRSLACHLLAPVQPGAVLLIPQLDRAGRSTTSTSLRFEQQGTVVATALASHARPNPSITHVGVTAPDAPAPTDCPPLLETVVEEARAGMLVEHRPVAPPRLLGGNRSARIVVWMRLLEERAVDAISATMLADAAPPALYASLTEPLPIPSTEITIHFADLAATGSSPWVLGVFWTTYAADGYAIEDTQLWSDGRRLILQARQLRRILGATR